MVQVRDRLIPLLHLGEVFGVAGRARADFAKARWSSPKTAAARVALVVDELLGKQEVVIKSLGDDVRGASRASPAAPFSATDASG